MPAGPSRPALRDEAPVRSLSIVTPVHNEEQNVATLVDELVAVLEPLGLSYEIIAVNDGSRDRSLAELHRLALRHPKLKVIDLRRNFGQTAALMCGIDHANGEVIVPIDADLQNDPQDIPRLLDKLAEGYDVVSGWREDRKDAAIRRNLVSRLANRLISAVSGVKLRDYGCTLKAYRQSVLEGVRLYGEMHRFVPVYAHWRGARITEIAVSHRPRLYGQSKYGLERIMKVLLDLIVIKFLDRHLVKPIYVFGSFGLLSIALSFGTGLWAAYLKLFAGASFISTPLPLISVMLFATGIGSVLMGLVCEILSRTYFESQSKRPYEVREILNR